MTKKAKISLSLLAISLSAVVYLILTSEIAPNQSNLLPDAAKMGADKLESDYKSQAKAILADYWRLIQVNPNSADEISALKNKLLALRVPVKFKELHLNLVFALVKMENYLASGRQTADKLEAERLISVARANNQWLNN